MNGWHPKLHGWTPSKILPMFTVPANFTALKKRFFFETQTSGGWINILPLMLPSPSRGHAGGVSILGKGSPECTIIGSDSLTFHENPRVPKGHTPATIANYSNIFEAIDLQSTNLILAFQIHRRMVILDLQFWATSVMMSRCLEYLMIAIWLVALNFLFNCFFANFASFCEFHVYSLWNVMFMGFHWLSSLSHQPWLWLQ